MGTTLILIINTWNNQFKSIKRTYHSVTWFFFDQMLCDIKGDNNVTILSINCVI